MGSFEGPPAAVGERRRRGTEDAVSDKPSYLGLLNAIALNEASAQRYLSVWIEATTDPDVQAVLRTVAWREGEHGMSFAKRINELGYELRRRDDPAEHEHAAVAGSDMSDLEKMEHFGLDRLDDVLHGFDDVFTDHSIDIRTGELLGRYVAEEFDTARLLRGCYEQLAARRAGAGGEAALADQVEALGRAVEELRQIVCAQTMPTGAS